MRRAHIILTLAALCLPITSQARDARQVRLFRAAHPCPSTGHHRGACPGWQVDHILALCAGGPDRPWNMQWLSAADHKLKTRSDVGRCRRQHPHHHQDLP